MEKQSAKRRELFKRRQSQLRSRIIRELEPPPRIIPSKASSNILDEPIPEINVPILKPSHPSRNSHVQPLKHLANRAANSVKKELNKFADWILSYIPEPIKKTVNKRVESLKEKVNRIFKKQEDQFTPKEQQTALKGYLKIHRIGGQRWIGYKIFLSIIKPKVLDLINQQKKPIKVKFIFTCNFIKKNPATGEIVETYGYFHTFVETVTEATDFSDLFNTMTNRLLELIEQFQNSGSGWVFDRVEYFDIHIDPLEPLSGSSYIPLPSKLASKQAIINVKNEKDHECFKWAVTSAVFPKKTHPERLNKQMRENSEKFDWSGIEFPVTLKQIDKFEKQNPYAINVFGYENVVYPLRLSNKHETEVINLLLISND